MNIITNNHWHNFLYGYELSEKEKEDFDYIDDIDSHDFIRYRGVLYDPSEFLCCPESLFKTWDGYHGDTFFSGVVLRYSPGCIEYQIGTYIS